MIIGQQEEQKLSLGDVSLRRREFCLISSGIVDQQGTAAVVPCAADRSECLDFVWNLNV